MWRPDLHTYLLRCGGRVPQLDVSVLVRAHGDFGPLGPFLLALNQACLSR